MMSAPMISRSHIMRDFEFGPEGVDRKAYHGFGIPLLCCSICKLFPAKL